MGSNLSTIPPQAFFIVIIKKFYSRWPSFPWIETLDSDFLVHPTSYFSYQPHGVFIIQGPGDYDDK